METFFIWAQKGEPPDMLTGNRPENVLGVRRHPDTKDHVVMARLHVESWEVAKKLYRELLDNLDTEAFDTLKEYGLDQGQFYPPTWELVDQKQPFSSPNWKRTTLEGEYSEEDGLWELIVGSHKIVVGRLGPRPADPWWMSGCVACELGRCFLASDALRRAERVFSAWLEEAQGLVGPGGALNWRELP